MAFIIAIQRDSQQAATLRQVLNEVSDVELLVVDSKDAALEAVDGRVPDVVLLDPFIDPGDDEHLVGYLRSHPSAAHVQVLTIPTLAAPREDTTEPRRFGRRRRKTAKVTPAECDPRLFASDVAGYVSWANTIKETVEERRAFGSPRPWDRRHATRWSPDALPWVAAVRMPEGEMAALVDLSSGGALVRTWQRPGRALFGRGDLDAEAQRSLRLRFQSGEEVRIAGQVVRCRVASNDDKNGLYEVAFRFDHSVDAYVPVSSGSIAPGGEASMVALTVRYDRQAAPPPHAPSRASLSLPEFIFAVEQRLSI